MPGLEDLNKSIERLEEAQKRLREETRLAHEAAQALKEQRQAAERLVKETMLELEDLIQKKVVKELAELGEQVDKSSNQIYDKVGRQIDLIINLSLGKHKSRAGNTQDIRPMLAEHLKEWLRENIEELAEKETDGLG